MQKCLVELCQEFDKPNKIFVSLKKKKTDSLVL